MLEISNLRVRYGESEVLKGINLKVDRGEILSIVGESGTGKTTLGLSIMGLLRERSANASVEGKILLGGVNIRELDERELRRIRWRRISMVFQNAEDALNPLYTVLDQVKEPLAKVCSDEAAEKKARHLLETVGFPPNRIGAYPHQLSLGEKQRALIAMAFICDPDVVILDEPTSSLDLISRGDIIRLLRELGENRAMLLITHDLATAARLSDRTAVLYGGYILELAPTQLLLSEPRHPYTRGLIRSYPDMRRTKDLQGMKGRVEFVEKGCPFYPRCTQAIETCLIKEPELNEIGDGRWIACHRGGIIPLLEVRGLTKSFDTFRAVDSVDLTLFEGETLALIGESGAGKTTLARLIMGLLEPTEGEILLEGKRVGERGKEFFRKVQMIFQNPRESLSPRLNVLEAVREPLDVQGIGAKEERRERVKAVLEEVELPSDERFLSRYPHELSGGEVQRVVIARALVLNPKLIIADEPTSSLDPSVQAKIMKLLNDIQERRGLGMLFITHDVALARKISDRVAVMRSGRIVEEGRSELILSSPSHPYTKALLRAATN